MVTLHLARRTVMRRPAGFLASFLALALAALIVMVCGGLLETGLRDDVPPQRLLTAPVVVTGVQAYRTEPLAERDRLDPALVRRVEAVPGVGRTVSDVSFPVTVLRDGRPLELPDVTGHGWSSAGLTPFRLIEGRAPAAPGDVVLDRQLAARLGLGVGGSLPVQARGTTVSLHVTGVAAAGTAQAPALFVTDSRAGNLLGAAGRVDSVAVYPAAGTTASQLAQRIRATLPAGSAIVLTGRNRSQAEFPAAAGQSTDLIPLASVSGGLMIAVAVFIVASTLALAVQLRRRQVALLRSIGATPGQLRRLVLGETFLLAVPAAALAALPSRLIGRRLLTAFADHGLAADRLVYHQGLIPTLTGAGVALLTGLVAALVAARGAIRVRPVEALRAESAPQRWLTWPRAVFGGVTLAGAIALAAVTILIFNGPIAASTAAPSAMLWAIGLGLLAPAVTRPLLAPLGRLAALLAPRTGHLAMLNQRGRGAATAALIVPVMLAIGLTTALLYLQTSLQQATDDAYSQHLRASLVMTSGAGLPLAVATRAGRVPGVAAASPLVTSSVFFNLPPGSEIDGPDSIPAEGLDAGAAGRVTSYPVIAGSLSQLRGNALAISADQRGPGRELGDTTAVRFGDDAVARLKIVAVISTQRGYPALLLPARLLAEHTTDGLAGQILISTTPGADRATIERSLAALAPGARVSDRAAALSAFSDQQQASDWVTYLFIAALIVYTAVSLVNTTVAATAARRPQLRAVRLLGASRRQVTRTLTIEALVVAAAGIVLGTLMALATLLPFDSALGVPGLPAGPAAMYLIVIGAAGALTVATTWVSARLLLARRTEEVGVTAS